LNEAALTRLHADAKSLHILTTSRAEFTTTARARSRIVGLIATPFPHATPEAVVDLVKQLIDSLRTRGGQTKHSDEDNSGSAMLAALGRASSRSNRSEP
jgi:hypothetical protein